MPATPETKPDQADLLAQVETLNGQLAEANKRITALTAAEGQVATLTAERDGLQTQLNDANGKVTSLTTERDNLSKQVTSLTAERDDFKAKAEPVQKQLAAQLAKHGIRTEAVGAVPAKQPGAERLTATEKVLAARGVSSLNDLANVAK